MPQCSHPLNTFLRLSLFLTLICLPTRGATRPFWGGECPGSFSKCQGSFSRYSGAYVVREGGAGAAAFFTLHLTLSGKVNICGRDDLFFFALHLTLVGKVDICGSNDLFFALHLTFGGKQAPVGLCLGSQLILVKLLFPTAYFEPELLTWAHINKDVSQVIKYNMSVIRLSMQISMV